VHRPTRPTVVPVPVPVLELWVGLVWWVVGTLALPAGFGTVVLAAALVVMAWMWRTVRRAHGAGARLPPGGRSELLRRGGVSLGVIVAASTALGFLGHGEYTVPLAGVLVGVALVRTSRVLDARSVAAAGTVVAALGVAGAFWALNTAGQVYGRGLVGIGIGAVLWLAAGYRTQLLVARHGPR